MTKKLASWSALQRELGSIVERLNADPALARAAALNPFYALEELGYEIEPQARAEFETRIRFGRRAERRPELRSEAETPAKPQASRAVVGPPRESGTVGVRAPRLADRANFEAVRSGRLETPLRRIRFHLRNRGTS